MSQPPDLCVTLTSPPRDAPSHVIARIALHCEALNLSHTGSLLTDPLTQRERDDLRWYLEEYWMWPYEGFAERGKEVEQLLVAIGQRLFQEVFAHPRAANLMQLWRSHPAESYQISITSELPAALSLPWELLHDGQNFLVLRAGHPVSIVRTLLLKEQREQKSAFAPPLGILLITSQPEGTGFVDPRSIARELFDELGDLMAAGAVELEFLRPPTLAALKAHLRKRKRPIHILHFDGHGVFGKQAAKQGMLAFEDGNGQLDPVKAEHLAEVLRDSGVRLVVLTACQSAMSSEEDIFSSVAAQLIRSGVDAVVAMSTNVLVTSTTRYVEAFYNALARGIPVAFAHERARQALHDDPYRHRQHRYQDEPGIPVKLNDWWMPHLYQQHPLVLQPAQSERRQKKISISSPAALLNEEMPGEPRYGFFGRARELLQLERWLLQGKMVLISGFGGVGKTSLAREAADWFTRTKMYAAACFVSFESGGDAAMLLSVLGHFLGIYDGYYNPNEIGSALARLKAVFRKKRLLIIADNLESILTEGEAPLPPEMREQLWSVLFELTKMGAGVLLTSRDASFREEVLLPDSQFAHLLLEGLRPNDAYALASHLLETLGIDPIRAPYIKLRELLSQLDYHPLAIQLVLPALRDLSIATIRADLSTLLPKFVDDAETGRNRSLLASLEYSLRRLSEEQRALLSRLAPFEGGASEDDLLAITEIPVSTWEKLRLALEQTGLMRAERVHNDIPAPFLHFHPVLTAYLRVQAGTSNKEVLERYARRYEDVATVLLDEDVFYPRAVRSLVRRELPNLCKAVSLLLERGELEAASDTAERVTIFFFILGRERERDELRQKVAQAMGKSTADLAGELTRAEFLYESGLGENKLGKGDIAGAYSIFTALLERIEALPPGKTPGPGSYAHAQTLGRVARCLRENGHPHEAEEQIRKALIIIGELIEQQPENQTYIRQRGVFLADLGSIVREQGLDAQAQPVFEEALQVAVEQGDLRQQAVVLAELGTVMLDQRRLEEAQEYYRKALASDVALGELALQAITLHQLGRVAQEQEDWARAERYYRKSLAIEERLGNTAGAIMSFNQLASVARASGRFAEAEQWWKRALELDEQVHPGSLAQATHLNNFAYLLLYEVSKGQAQIERLVEARDYAQRALAIKKQFDASAATPWNTLSILADIASLEGQAEEARDYNRQEREAFASCAANRARIDYICGNLIHAVAAAASDPVMQAEVEEALPEVDAGGWRVRGAAKWIWAGERDWYQLTEDMDPQDALVILRVLETLESSAHSQPLGEQDKT